MRVGLFAVVAVLFSTDQARAQAAEPPLPPIVFQMQPPGQVLDSLRFAAELIGGEKGVKAINKELKGLFGEKGIDGIDQNRPVVGYAFGALKLDDFTFVVALPVTTEKEFLTMCDRINKDKLTVDAKDKTLYHLPPMEPGYKAMLRFSEQYAYIAYGKNPAAHIEAKALVPVAKLYDRADRAIATGRIYFDRDPYGTKVAGWLGVNLVNGVIRGFGGGIFRFGGFHELGTSLATGVENAMFRFLLNGGADTFVARVSIDPATAEFITEVTLTPKPGTELAKNIAEFKLAPNRFASITNHPDTAAAVHGRLPAFTSEIRTSVSALFDKSLKQLENRPVPEKPAAEELLKGLIRTVKDGDLDVAVALRGPDKDGYFTAIGGIAFDNPALLEKEVKALFNKVAPDPIKDLMKWDADRAGKIAIHTFQVKQDAFKEITNVLGGEKCLAAFAFAPQGIVGVVGTDPVPVLKDILAAKPVAAPWIEVVLNPDRAVKAIEKIAGPNNREATQIATAFGRDDKKMSALSMTLEGGKELKATFKANLRLLPRMMFAETLDRANRIEDQPVPPVQIEK